MKRALLVCSIGVLVPLSAALSQDTAPQRSASWAIMAGGVAVNGGLSGALTGGPVGGIEGEFPLEIPHVSMRGDILYSWMAEYFYHCDFCGSSQTWSRLISTSLSLVYRPYDQVKRLSPYVFAGVAGHLTGAGDEPLASMGVSKIGIEGGVGLEYRPHSRTYFAEVRYFRLAPGGILPFVLGMRF
jgi:hypothetical protein